MQVNHITVKSPKIGKALTLALCPDFHNGDWESLKTAVKGADGILIIGDLVDRHDRRTNGYDNALRVLREAPDVAPVFYAIGNHERRLKTREAYWPHVENSRVRVLDDEWVEFGGIRLGGLSSRKHPETRWLAGMEGSAFTLLMCHHPEHFRHVKPYAIDLTLSGHAHGGQVRIGQQGLYSPGQGIFPRLTSGFYEGGRLLVSRGVTNATWAPRIHCDTEVIMLHLEEDHAQD